MDSFHVLVVCNEQILSNQLRQSLLRLGIRHITTPSHTVGVTEVKQTRFTHVFFDLYNADMPTVSFVEKILELDPDTTVIAVTLQPQIDDIFKLLRAGTRGFLVYPFSPETLEEVFITATSKIRVSEAIFHSDERNVPLAESVLNSLDRLCSAISTSRNKLGLRDHLDHMMSEFRESAELGARYSQGGHDAFLETIVDTCVNRANNGPRRLKKIREHLRQQRQVDRINKLKQQLQSLGEE